MDQMVGLGFGNRLVCDVWGFYLVEVYQMNWITAILEIAKHLSRPFASWWEGHLVDKAIKDKIDRLEERDRRRREIDLAKKLWKEAKTNEEKDKYFNKYLDLIRSID